MGKISREKFIRLGTALGVGAATASLAACGGGSGGQGSGSGDSGSGGATPAASTPASSSPAGASSPSGETTVSGGGGEGGGGSGGSGSGGSNPNAIAQASEVSPGSAVEFQDGGQPAVLVHLDNGDFVAYSAVCTHAQCTVAYRNDQLACPCHGSIFDPANGAAVIAGPAPTPLQEIPVSVEGGSVVKS